MRSICLVIVLLFIMASSSYASHEMGVFSVNRRVRISFTESALGLTYTIDFAEAPASDEIKLADANGDGEIDEAEKTIYFIGLARRIREGFRLSLGHQQLDLRLQSSRGEFPENEQGDKTVKCDLLFRANLPAHWHGGSLTLDDAVFSERIGAREVIVDPPPGWILETKDGTPKDGSYFFEGPKGSGPWSARLDLKPGPAKAGGEAPQNIPPDQLKKEAPETVAYRTTFSRLVLWALVLAFIVGAGHAFTPGHGAAFVSAYLVGPRRSAAYAALLGWVVTAIRTTPVFSLGVVMLLLDRFLLPASSLKWLRFCSAAAVLIAGLIIIGWNRLARAQKEPPVPTGVSTVELVGLGIAGGLAPSPSALALLLGAVGMSQSALGLGMVVAFGFGLETALTLSGIVRLKSPSFADWLEEIGEKLRFMSLVWGIFILVIGALLIFRAIQNW